MDRMTLPSDSGYGGSDLRGKMTRQGQFEPQYLGTNLSSTNDEVFLPPMPGSWQDYREEDYAPSVSVFSGNEPVPDTTSLYSPLDYSTDPNMGQQYDGAEALAQTGALLPLSSSMSQMDMSASPTLMLHRGSSGFQQDTDPADFASGVADFLNDYDLNMKRPRPYDTPSSPNKKRSLGPRSNPDRSYGAQSSPGSSHVLSRNVSSAGHSSLYPPPAAETYGRDPLQSQDSNIDWQSYNQAQTSPTEAESHEQASPSHEKPKKAKKRYPCLECSKDKVFTTSNDLERHLKTVHGRIKVGEKVWLCNIGNCQGGRKVWARMDNFKQHITRMHNQKNTEMIEQMSVRYDPKLHDIQISRNKTGRSSLQGVEGERSGGESQRPGVPAFHGISQDRQHFLHTSNTTSRGDTSMQNNNSQSPTVSSLFDVQRHQTQRRSSHTPNQDRRVLRRPAYTIANMEVIRDHEHEMLLDNSIPLPDFTQGNSQQDLLNMGSLLTPEPQESARAGQIVLGHSGQSGSLYPRMTSQEAEILRCFGNLPIESRNRLLNRLNAPERPQSQSRQRSESMSKSQSAKMADSTKDAMIQCKTPGCGKIFAKPAELRKHQARHERKYGCTFDQCSKKFGTKWEWKRHERSQHVQDTEWRCDVEIAGKPCGQAFRGDQDFKFHLTKQHHLSDSATQERLRTCMLAKKWIGSFWCGFCVKVIPKPGIVGSDSYEARYSHIADHIDKDQQCSIGQWIEVSGGGKTKAEIKKSMDDASLRSPTDTSTSQADHNEGESSESTGEEDNDQDDIATEAQPPSLHLNTVRATASQSSHNQTGFPSTSRSPQILVSPPEQFTNQANFMTDQFYNSDIQARPQSDFGPSGFTNQFPPSCNNCGSHLIYTQSGYICQHQDCGSNVWGFVNPGQLQN